MFSLENFNFAQSIAGLLPFLAYFGTSLGMVMVFAVIYTFVTPHDEIGEIKKNNVSAAISFVGAMLGFTLPLMTAMNVSTNFYDFLVWGAVAAIAQIILFFSIRIVFPRMVCRIKDGEVAMGVLVAGVSILVGLANSTSMIP